MELFKKSLLYSFCFYIISYLILPEKISIFHKNLPVSDIFLLIIVLFYAIFVLLYKENRKNIFNNIKAFLVNKFSLSMVILFCIMLLSITYARDKGIAIQESFRFATYIFMIYFITTEFMNLSSFKTIINTSILGTFLVSLFGVIQYFTNFMLPEEYIHYDGSVKRAISTFSNPNTLGAFDVVVLFPIVYLCITEKKKYKKVFYILTALLITSNIFLSGSRSAFIGLVVGILILVILVNWKYVVLLLLGGGAASFLSKSVNIRVLDVANSTLNASRIKMWETGIQMIKDHPILGLGNGNYLTHYNNYIDTHPNLQFMWYRNLPSHNSYIKVWSELGIAGIVTFIYMIIISVLRVMAAAMHSSDNFISSFYKGFLCSLGGFLVMNCFDNLLFVPKIALFFWVFLSLDIKSKVNTENII